MRTSELRIIQNSLVFSLEVINQEVDWLKKDLTTLEPSNTYYKEVTKSIKNRLTVLRKKRSKIASTLKMVKVIDQLLYLKSVTKLL